MKPDTLRILCFTTLVIVIGVLSSCRKPQTIPTLKGSWTAMGSTPGYTTISTATGLMSFGSVNPFSSFPPDVWFSTNQGITWTGASGNPLWGASYYLDQLNHFNVLAYSETDSVFYISQNGGQTWALLNQLHLGLNQTFLTDTGFHGYDIGIMMLRNGRIFASRNTYTGGLNGRSTLVKSDDNGTTWDSIFTLANGEELSSVDSMLYQYDEWTIDKSTDNGNTWTVVNQSSPVLQLIPATSTSYLVGMDPEENLYASHDQGANWTKIFQVQYGSSSTPSIVFDSTLLINMYYMGTMHTLCSNLAKINWLDAAPPQSPSAFFVDSVYVYSFSPNANTYLYRRPRSDFKGL